LDPSAQKLLGYQESLNHMRLHSNLIWTRNSFFLLVHTGLLAVAANESFDRGELEKVLGVAGLFLAFIWLWVNWAGQQLQRRWRKVVLEFEQDLFSDQKTPGPFARVTVAKGLSSWAVSITSALLVLSFGCIVLWGFFILRAWR